MCEAGQDVCEIGVLNVNEMVPMKMTALPPISRVVSGESAKLQRPMTWCDLGKLSSADMNSL